MEASRLVETNVQSHGDDTFEYWAGNPSVEIAHGYIRTTGSGGSGSTSHSSCVALASSVPCHMSPTDFCEFVGAFDEATHRDFRHCRVLHGLSSEEYLIAIWLSSTEATDALIKQYGSKQYNALEPDVCNLHRVVSCQKSTFAAEDGGMSGRSPTKSRKISEEPPSPLVMPRAASPPLVNPLPSPTLRSVSQRWSPARSPSPVDHEHLHSDSNEGSGSGNLDSLFLDCESLRGGDHGKGEKNFCAVCLEHIDPCPENYQITEMGGGMPLTILCGHSFHSRCLSRWCDTTCPVCRFQQHPYRMSCCDVCGNSEGLHVCLVCGFISCTQEQHAQQHFEATSHTYAIEVSTQRVWDYSGNGYVHRLLFNHEDGKVVEHSVPALADDAATAGSAAAASASSVPLIGDRESRRRWSDMAEEDDDCFDGCAEWARDDARLDPSKKAQKESVVSEFNALLASQMTAQRRYYEDRQKELELEHRQELRSHEDRLESANASLHDAEQQLQQAIADNLALEAEIAKMVANEEKARKQIKALEGLNEKISQEQRSFESTREDEREQQKAAKQQRSRDVEDLQQQIRDLELFLQMRKRCENSAEAAELQDSHCVLTEGATGRGRGGRRGGRAGARRR